MFINALYQIEKQSTCVHQLQYQPSLSLIHHLICTSIYYENCTLWKDNRLKPAKKIVHQKRYLDLAILSMPIFNQ